MSGDFKDIHWYPGHMTKAKRMMAEHMQLIDVVIELIDARIPYSSRNPDIDELRGNKFGIIILNKSDLADPSKTDLWTSYFKSCGLYTVCADSRSSKLLNPVKTALKNVMAEKKAKDLKKGILNRPVRAMVAGIPNVGKSTFINCLSKKSAAKTGNKPGVTKGKQWIHFEGVDLLDTPGILWPKQESQITARHLALIGSINDDILQTNELAVMILDFLREEYPDLLSKRYAVKSDQIQDNGQVLEDIARFRRLLSKGGIFDIEKAARILIDEFRSGAIGRITLETP